MTLLHFCWEGALIAAAFAIALALLRRARPETRYAAACATLAAMVAAPVVTFLRIGNSLVLPATTAAAQGAGSAMDRALAPAPAAPLDNLAPWIALCWLAGVAVLTVRWGLAWAVLERRVRQSSAIVPADLIAALERVRVRMSIARDIPVRMADWVDSPAVSRWIRPVLLIPAAAVAGLNLDQIEAIFAHELAHIRRHDYLVNLLQTAIETLLFYHPAVWWVSRQIRVEREHCCDDLAVASCGERRVYASALLELERHRAARPVLAMAASGGSLKARIARVLYPRQAAPSSMGASAILFAMAVLFFCSGLRMTAQVADGPYAKWLNEEAVYIITAEERQAFTGLRTDPDRNRFIEQFWLRRDPTPGTARNEYQEEHYRRIGYASGRFSGPQIPGWKTDRGRIYILYGPPDELEVHPATTREAWLYRFIDGIGTNVVFEFQEGKLKAAAAK